MLRRERDLISQCEEKSHELREKEALMNELLKKHDLPILTSSLKKAILALERTSQGTTGTYASVRGSIEH